MNLESKFWAQFYSPKTIQLQTYTVTKSPPPNKQLIIHKFHIHFEICHQNLMTVAELQCQ